MKKIQNKKAQMSEGYKVILFLLGFFIIIGVIIIIASQNDKNSQSVTGDVVSENGDDVQNCRDVQVPYEEQEEYMKTEYYTEREPYTDTECQTKDLVSTINSRFDYNTCNSQEEKCIKWEDHWWYGTRCTEKKTFCVDRTVSCSVDIRNLDLETTGTWTVKHSFNTAEQKDFKTAENSATIPPQSVKTITNQITIKSIGEDGEATKDIINCGYVVTKTPTKQVCRDVIKYREIQKSREVTAYKPVTKYRTETKCD